MDLMNIFQTNWLDFLTWTLAVCMGIAVLVYAAERWGPSNVFEKTKKIRDWPRSLRKAS